MCYGLNKTKINLTQLAIIQTFWKAGPLFAVCTKSLESDYKAGQNRIRPFKHNCLFFFCLPSNNFCLSYKLKNRRKKVPLISLCSVRIFKRGLRGWGAGWCEPTGCLPEAVGTPLCLLTQEAQGLAVQGWFRVRQGKAHSKFSDIFFIFFLLGRVSTILSPAAELGCQVRCPKAGTPAPGWCTPKVQECVRLSSSDWKLDKHLYCLLAWTKLQKLSFSFFN